MLVHVLIRCLPQRVERCYLNVEVSMLSFRLRIAIVPNRSSSVGGQEFPPNACRGERCGVWGAHSPQQTGSSHGGKGFIRFTGFPEREEQYGELSCDSDDGALLGPCCSLLGET